MRILTWNLFHGRARPAAGRPLLVEFARALRRWEWDVALLQEVPPWWPPALAHACQAQQRTVLTSRNELLRARRAIAARNPDLITANGGGANAILARAGVEEDAWAELTRRPERRVAHGVRVGGVWVVNLHTTTEPKDRTRADVQVARAAAERWAGDGRLVLGGDFNLRRVELPGYALLGSNHVDHVYARGLEAGGKAELLDPGSLSDHRPMLVRSVP